MSARTTLAVSAIVLILVLTMASCAPAATPTSQAVQATAPAAPAPETTQPPVPTDVSISPPAAGGGVIAPTNTAPTPTLPSVAAGRTLSGWAQVSVANSPPARYDHTLTLDPVGNKLVLFGGRDGSKTLGDTWIFDLKTNAWRQLQTSPAPEARFGHAAAYDAQSRRVLVFAGQAGGFFNDVWAFDPAAETWQKLQTTGAPPVARYGTSAVIDAKTNQLVISHGFASGRFDDTFALDLNSLAWSQMAAVDGVPLKRCLHESVYDARTDRMVLFGGCSSGYGPCPQGDLWSLNVSGGDWNEISPQGVKPSPRSNPALVGDDAGRLILFGGQTRDGPSSDVWALDIASGEWTDLTPSAGGPAARSSHDAAWDPAARRVAVFGGKGRSGALNDMWVFTP